MARSAEARTNVATGPLGRDTQHAGDAARASGAAPSSSFAPPLGSAAIPNRTALAPALLVDELARAGVRDVCVSPGSRSAPLVSALIAHDGLRLWSHVDERSGAFFALGLARAARRPVAIVCTSGTAVANLLPAVVEAYHARVPLIVLTADRPPELRDCGAGQTIDQRSIFGTHVRWSFDLGTPEATPDVLRHVRAVACRAVAVARGDAGSVAGPVHLNVPLREPLDPRPVPGDVAAALLATPAARGRDGTAWTRSARTRPAIDDATLEEIAGLLGRARRVLVVAGPLDDDDPATVPAVAGLCAALRAPLLAELASNLRHEPATRFLADAADAIVGAPQVEEPSTAWSPDAIVRIGPVPTAKALATWLARRDGVPQIVIDAAATWTDPAAVATHLVVASPAVVCTSLAARLGALRAVAGGRRDADDAWLERWQSAGRRGRASLDVATSPPASAVPAALAASAAQVASCADRSGAPPVFEGHAIHALAHALPPGAVLYAGNSLAVRALEAYWPSGAPSPRVLANRGANGIDGFVSSVLGAAAADPSLPTVGVCGDLSFYHDLNGLLAARRHGVRAVLLVLNNDGGGIFDHLPIAAHRAGYEEHFATPHGLDFQPAVEMYGCAFERVTRAEDLGAALARALASRRTAVVELRFARATSLAAWSAARGGAIRAAAAEEDGACTSS